jgi:MFS family permease
VSLQRDEAPAGWLNRNVLAMGVTSFLSDLGHEMATAVLPAFIAILGLGPATLGIIEGVADGISAAVKLGAGWLSDRTSHRKTIPVVGYYLTGASKALFALAHGWPLLLTGRVLAWLGRGIRGPVRDAMLADSVPHSSIGRAFGFHRAGDTLGAVAGPLAALGVLAAFGHAESIYRSIFLLTLVPGLASAALFSIAVREPGRHRGASAPATGAAALPTDFRVFLWAVGLFGLADFAPTLLILRASDALSGSLGAAAAATAAVELYVLRNVIYAAASYPVGAMSDRHGRGWLLAGGYALLVPVAIGAAIAGGSLALFVVVFVLSGLVAAAQDSLEGAMAADLLPVRARGTGFGALSTVNAIGDLLSSTWVGLVWSRVSPELAFGLAGGLAIAGTLAMTRIALRGTPPRSPRS